MIELRMNNLLSFNFWLCCLLLLGTCSGEADNQTTEEEISTQEQENQVQEFRERIDKLDTTVLSRIQQLEDSLQNITADQREAIEREITYLREIHEELSTRKDNLKVEHRDNWHFFRQDMEESLVEIESRLNRTQ